MTADDLREEVSIELEHMETILQELSALRNDVAGRGPTVREKTAAAEDRLGSKLDNEFRGQYA